MRLLLWLSVVLVVISLVLLVLGVREAVDGLLWGAVAASVAAAALVVVVLRHRRASADFS
jgi:F0F1-type ATP synthase assembly protein I